MSRKAVSWSGVRVWVVVADTPWEEFYIDKGHRYYVFDSELKAHAWCRRLGQGYKVVEGRLV